MNFEYYLKLNFNSLTNIGLLLFKKNLNGMLRQFIKKIFRTKTKK